MVQFDYMTKFQSPYPDNPEEFSPGTARIFRVEELDGTGSPLRGVFVKEISGVHLNLGTNEGLPYVAVVTAQNGREVFRAIPVHSDAQDGLFTFECFFQQSSLPVQFAWYRLELFFGVVKPEFHPEEPSVEG